MSIAATTPARLVLTVLRALRAFSRVKPAASAALAATAAMAVLVVSAAWTVPAWARSRRAQNSLLMPISELIARVEFS